MLTFTVAPKTVLGPCTHALWDGVAIFSRHHRHMPDGEADWKEKITRILSSRDIQKHADGLVVTMRKQSALIKVKPADSKQFKALMTDEFCARSLIEDATPDADLDAITPPNSDRASRAADREKVARVIAADSLKDAIAAAQ